MHKINLSDAQVCLADLIKEAAMGEDVIITQDDGSAFKIVPLTQGKPIPKFGSAKGMFEMSDDFDAPLEDFEEYAP